MSNPIYHDDPDWYERPGETVHLHVDEHATQFTGVALPWNVSKWDSVTPRYFSEVSAITSRGKPDPSTRKHARMTLREPWE